MIGLYYIIVAAAVYCVNLLPDGYNWPAAIVLLTVAIENCSRKSSVLKQSVMAKKLLQKRALFTNLNIFHTVLSNIMISDIELSWAQV